MKDLITIKVSKVARANLKYISGITGKELNEVVDELAQREYDKQSRRLAKRVNQLNKTIK